MTTTQIRTTIATLAAAFTVALATAPVTPDAQARPNDGRYQNSIEAKNKKTVCGDLQAIFETAIQESREWADLRDQTPAGKGRDYADAMSFAELESAQKANDDLTRYRC